MPPGQRPHEGRRRLLAARAPRHAAGGGRVRRDVRRVCLEPPGGAERQRRHHGGQQGRAARHRGDGADDGRAHLGHRPVGGHGDGAGQLPRVGDRRGLAAGRAAYAVGSSEVAAYMSGVPVRGAKFVAYTLSGVLAAVAGLFITCITYSGEASAANGNTYTLYSIAAVVLGGVSLFGGSGSAVGAVFGALMFRTIGDLLFVFNLDPLWQPLFQGVVLALAVCLGSVRLLRVRNRLDLYG